MNTTIQKQLEEIDASIREVANKDPLADYVDPIYDGVADLERYLHAQPRVMWLMKEPYDSTDENGNPFGGGWRLTDCFRKDDVLNCRSWHPIIYVMYGIINGCKWDDMDWIRDDKSMVDVLQTIAYLNLCKMPNSSRSNNALVARKYSNIWKPVTLRQIEVLNPDVIICAGTFHIASRDLGIPPEATPIQTFADGVVKLYLTGSRKIIDTYHPNQRSVGHEKYVDGIIDAIRTL